MNRGKFYLEVVNTESFPLFSSGEQINNETVKNWIKRGVDSVMDKLESDQRLTESFTTISSGNTKVFIEAYKNKEGNVDFNISISKNFQSAWFFDVEL